MRNSPRRKTKDDTRTHEKLLHVLVVDHDRELQQMITDLLGMETVQIARVADAAEARRYMNDEEVDIALLDSRLPDGAGMQLPGEWLKSHPHVQSILVTGRPNYQQAVAALRAGVSDLLPRPIRVQDLGECLDRAMHRRAIDQRSTLRMNRLRDLCRRLSRERHEISEQVDSLCNDLADAYKELAGQFKHLQLTTRFKAVIEQELDLEQVLRRYLEAMLQELGPTNAAVFLPSTAGSFAVGGYINFDLAKPSLEEMMRELAEHAAPAVANQLDSKTLTGAEELNPWAGMELPWLDGRTVVALPCRDANEMMAAVLIFRDSDEPFDAQAIEAIATLSPILAEHLTKVVHVHHRLNNNDAAFEKRDGADPDEIEFD